MTDTISSPEGHGQQTAEQALDEAFENSDIEARIQLEPQEEEVISADTPIFTDTSGTSILAAIDMGSPHDAEDKGDKRLLVLHDQNEGYFLVGQNSDGEPQEMRLEPSELWTQIGADFHNGSFDSPHGSRQVRVDTNGRLHIQDMGSDGGTFVRVGEDRSYEGKHTPKRGKHAKAETDEDVAASYDTYLAERAARREDANHAGDEVVETVAHANKDEAAEELPPEVEPANVAKSAPEAEAAEQQEAAPELRVPTADEIFTSVDSFLRILHTEDIEPHVRRDMLHAIGLMAERQRADRVDEIWQNVVQPQANRLYGHVDSVLNQQEYLSDGVTRFRQSMLSLVNIIQESPGVGDYVMSAYNQTLQNGESLVSNLHECRQAEEMRSAAVELMYGTADYENKIRLAVAVDNPVEDPDLIEALIAYRASGQNLDGVVGQLETERESNRNIALFRTRREALEAMVNMGLRSAMNREGLSGFAANITHNILEPISEYRNRARAHFEHGDRPGVVVRDGYEIEASYTNSSTLSNLLAELEELRILALSFRNESEVLAR